jgi:hypothetical protein
MDFIWIFLIITAIVYLLLRYYPRKPKKRQVEQVGMDSLGFLPVPYPEAILKKKIVQLHTKYDGQQIAMHDVFQRKSEGVDKPGIEDQWTYLFDLEDQAGKEPAILAQDVIAIISTHLDLPRISILTRPNVTGGFGGMMDRLVSRMANWENNTQSLRRITFPDQPDLNNRYFFFSPDEAHARAFLSPSRLVLLQNLQEHYAIDMDNDLVTIHKVVTNSSTRREQILQTLADAIDLVNILKEPPDSDKS